MAEIFIKLEKPHVLKILGKFRSFKTGRHYGPNGQQIDWAIVDKGEGRRVVVFTDQDRMIDGVIDLHFGNLDLVDDRWVLRAYDDHHYHGDYDVLGFWRDALRMGESMYRIDPDGYFARGR